MQKVKTSIYFIIIACLFLNSVAGRSKYDKTTDYSPDGFFKTTSELGFDEIIDPIISWPTSLGMLESEQIQNAFGCTGELGTGYFSQPGWPYPSGWEIRSFASPKGSDNNYLWSGALWIGGIVNFDTLVSVGMDGWQSIMEMWPSGNPPKPSVNKLDYIADYSLRAVVFDTLTDEEYVYFDDFEGRPHIPLNLKIVNRGYIWRNRPIDMTVIYDMVISNIGDNQINDGYIACFADGDVYHGYMDYEDYIDDISGSIKSAGIAYTIDNDGDPDNNSVFVDSSLTRALAIKFLYTSFEPSDTNFNWYVPNGNPDLNFGPRLKPSEEDPWRDFGGFLGTPMGDRNKYYMMSHDEWDYDQIMTATITDENPTWMQCPIMAYDFANGHDTKFVLSIGSFDLAPDSSIRVLYAMFTDDSVHVDPNNYVDNYDADFPEMFYLNLNFEGLVEVADTSLSLASRLLNPNLPVTGLEITYSDIDSIIIEWDPYVFDSVDGYQIYLTEINPEDWPYLGAMPPWFRPDSLMPFEITGRQFKYRFGSLDQTKAYYVNVANWKEESTGDAGYPVLVQSADYDTGPESVYEYCFHISAGPATFEWLPVEHFNVHHYNIYRFNNIDSANEKYRTFYDEGYHKDNIMPKDSFNIEGNNYYYYSLEPYAQVDSGINIFTDFNANDSNVYAITAVDKLGFETQFSNNITFSILPQRTKDILVLISGVQKNSDFVIYDSILSFYDSILQGYDYDIFDYADSTSLSNCDISPLESCVDWLDFIPYKLLLVEDGLTDGGQIMQYDDYEKGLTRYIISGGQLCYFGTPLSFVGINTIYEYGPAFFAADHPFLNRFFGIDSIFCVSPDYYFSTSTSPYVDSTFGFIGAQGLNDIPNISYDTGRWPFYINLMGFWPTNTAPLVATYKVNSNGQTTHLYQSLYPEKSICANEPVGVMTETSTSRTYMFGFHLWYMNYSESRELIDYIMADIPTGIAEAPTLIPNKFALYQNFPNPFNMTTSISFSLAERSDVRIDIYNILGRRIITLYNDIKAAGYHTLDWDGCDDDGTDLASGMYFYRIETDKFRETRKMILLK